MPHCCGPSNKESKPKEVRKSEVKEAKERPAGESFGKRLLKSLGFGGQEKDLAGDN